MPPPPPDAVRRLSHYELGDLLGEGGMGAVYRATDMRSGVAVALKLVHPHLAGDPTFIDRFRREAHIASLLASPYVVRLLDFGLDQGRYFMVSEFVEGTKLSDVLRQGRLEPLQGLAIAAQVALALGEAETREIVHRDIKPDNIIITPDKSVKVLDFGIARLAGAPGVTTTGVFVGTPAYSAPEQFLDKADTRSDIYALGIVLFLMLAGELPFTAPTPTGFMRLHEDEPPPLQKLAGVPAPVVDIVARCLAKAPADRYQHISQLLMAVETARQTVASTPTDSWMSDATAVVARARIQPAPSVPVDVGPTLPRVAPPPGVPAEDGPTLPAGQRAGSVPPVPMPQGADSPPTQRPPRAGNRRLIVGGGAVALIAVVAVAGFFAMQGSGSNGNGKPTPIVQSPGGSGEPTSVQSPGGDDQPSSTQEDTVRAALLDISDFPAGWTAGPGGQNLQFQLEGECAALAAEAFPGQLTALESERFFGPTDEDIRTRVRAYDSESSAIAASDAVTSADATCRDDLEREYQRLLREFYEGTDVISVGAAIDDLPPPGLGDYADARRVTLTAVGSETETMVTDIVSIRIGRLTATYYYEDTAPDDAARERYLDVFVEKLSAAATAINE